MRLPHLPAGSLPVTQNFERIQALMPSGVVTKLPSAPIDEQEINYLADSANGVVWRFRYRAASTSTHRWEFVGGSKLHSENNEVSLFTLASNAFVYQEIPKPPSVTIPLAGEYEVTFRLEYLQQASAGETQQLNIGVGSATNAIYLLGAFIGEKQFATVPVTEYQRISLTAGLVLKLFASGNNLNQWQTGAKAISATPVRVG